MDKYFLYSYLDAIELRYHDYKNENELNRNDFDTGKVKGFNNAISIIKKILKDNEILEINKAEPEDSEVVRKRKNIMTFNLNTELEPENKCLVEITKKYVISVQELYNNLVGNKDLLNRGEMFGYYDVLDMLELDLKYTEDRKLFKNFNISIPISLNEKVKISKL